MRSLVQEYFTCRELSEKSGLAHGKICELCDAGEVPFAQRVGHRWLIARDGLDFLLEWSAKRERFGLSWRQEMAKAAAKADPQCVPRQPERDEHILTPEEIRDIKKRKKRGQTLRRIGGKYDLTPSGVSRIVNNQRHAGVR
jgi:hypothetical protein